MPPPPTSRLASALTRMQWRRGLRAGTVIVTIAVVCHALRQPLGWAAVGGFLAVMVDSGGSYRSRLTHVASFLAGGTLACIAGTLAATSLPATILITAVFCFSVTFARILSQPLAVSSVSILVCYFVAFGSGAVPARAVAANVALFLSGGLWAAALILLFWPIDAFRPARLAVAECFTLLTKLAQRMSDPSTEAKQAHALHAQLRIAIETAHDALSHTPTRVPSRTVRARNLAVLLEDVDLLFARMLNLAELTESQPATQRNELATWLASATQTVDDALRQRPLNNGAAFSAEGSLTAGLRLHATRITAPLPADETHMQAIMGDLVLTLEVAFEAVRAIWSGVEPRTSRASALRFSLADAARQTSEPWLESLRAHWTPNSIMLRHAVRLALVAVVDVLIMRRIHITHGFWLAMTSIIVLQPYTGHTLRRFAERVGGTVAGGMLAAVLASALPNEPALVAVVIVCAIFAGAVYAVDYGWYCFFLTPTFVLLAMPHLRDWHFAAIRMGTTLIGASTAVLGMLLLGRQREAQQLPTLLGRAVAADAAYVQAMLRFWHTGPAGSPTARATAERSTLAPARRACGMATTEAEESLDRALLEPSLSLRGKHREDDHLHQAALTFTTYLRRLTQSITALAVIGAESQEQERTVVRFADRLQRVASTLPSTDPDPFDPRNGHPDPEPAEGERSAFLPKLIASRATTLATQQLRRMERQVSILERTAAEIIRPA